jgi:ATP-dependent Clp protease ATP-binding subunit ClpC
MDLPPLSHAAQQLMSGAAAEAARRQHHYLGVEHIFAALGQSGRTSLAATLTRQGVQPAVLWADLMEASPAYPQRPWGREILITPRCQKVLRVAAALAARKGSAQVEEAHILEAILHEARSTPLRRLLAQGIHVAELYEAVMPSSPSAGAESTPTLNKLGRDLTARALAGALAPVIGREDELTELSLVLLRRNKNNPVLVGEAGVGKTAIVEGLARRLASDECPASLQGCRLVEIALPALVAGTRYRGDFEERLLDVVREASSVPGIILFIDEIHTVVGAGSSTGALDAANILKPSLARGEIRCIGSTTIEEYRRWIEQDAALERRFEKVRVEEPSPEQARRILEGVAGTLASFHSVEVPAEAQRAAVELTVRYVPGRRLPDKALDALDQSCARVRLNAPAATSPERPLQVSADDVARTVARWTGIPIERLSREDAQDLLSLDERLRSRLVGQDHAVSAVSRAIVTMRSGLASPGRPASVLMFVGPTGVGKTELARGLAEVVFGDEKRLIRFDMSEFGEPHSVARLLGAPPGYVGHEAAGRLVSAIRTAPHSVVLFDEVEKAHRGIFDVFLQIFDEGRLTGADGTMADFRHAILILTSNIDPRPEPERRRVGFLDEDGGVDIQPDLRVALTAWLQPELINRIDEIVLFRPLSPRDLWRILERYLEEIEALGAPRGLRLEVDEPARDWLIRQSDPRFFGARELRRVVERCVRQPLAHEILRRSVPIGTVRVTLDGGTLRLI